MSKIKDNGKKSFVMYDSFVETMMHLDDKDFRECFMKIRDYALERVDEESKSPMVNVIMALAKPNLDSARRRYMASVENGKKGAEYGKLGGAPKGNQNARKKQPQKQPLDVDVNVDVEEDENENEEVDVNVNEDAPVGDIVPSSFSCFSSSRAPHTYQEPPREAPSHSNTQSIEAEQTNKGETHINSKVDSHCVSLGTGTATSSGNGFQSRHREEGGISMSEYVESLIKRDIARLGEAVLNGEEYDKTILNQAIDNLIALYGKHDRKTGYAAILSAVEQYVQNNTQ
ncbi:MAG: hypothetical protein IJZ09_03695 [Tidjanibacter sp.]|nr:hypothetical protein [Tidjanibacter sp.]